MATTKRSRSNDSNVSSLYKEWDEVSCPICMDHPHNAVLLICTSCEKGCHSYICDTSYRHSNCLDRFKTLKEEENADNSPTPNLTPGNHHDSTDTSNLRCPLCRGGVLGWKIADGARKYLDLKSRSCSRESCSFSGNYMELRRHARRAHPTVRPGHVDPSRQRAWARLEGQREYNDIVSALGSAMPGAVVIGDYVIENGDRGSVERDRGGWLSTLFLLQMFSMDGGGGSRGLPRRRRAASGTSSSSRRRYLWGENLLGFRNVEDESEEGRVADWGVGRERVDDVSRRSRRRRRLTRGPSDEDRE